MASPSLVFFFLALWALGAASASCEPSITLAAWRAVGDDGSVAVSLYAGHHFQQITLGVVWQRSATFPLTNVSGTVILPRTSSLLVLDAPDDWYDGQSAMTLERIALMSRNQLFTWHVSALAAGAEPPVLLSTAGTTPTPVAGYLYLGSDSPLWLTYDLVIFTGAHLQFVPRRPGVLCNATKAVQAPPGARLLYADGKTVHGLVVRDSAGVARVARNVTLRVDFNMAQTFLPLEVAAALKADPKSHLHIDPEIDFTSGSDVAAALDVTALPGLGRNEVRIGRRSLRKLAMAWTLDAQGDSLVWIESSESDDVPEGALWASAIFGTFLVVAAAHWLSYLGHTLRLYYRPTRRQRQHESEAKVTLTHLILGYFVLAASIVTHALMGVYGGHGQLADTSFAEPLRRLILSQWIASLALGLIPFLSVLISQTVHVIRNNKTRRHAHRPSAVPVQLFSIVMGTSAARGVIAALLMSAGQHLGVIFVTLVAALALAYFATTYTTIILLAHLIARVDLHDMPDANKEPGWIPLAWVITLQQALFSVLVGVTFALWVCVPWLDVMNSLYSSELVTATTTLLFAAPILLAVYSTSTQIGHLLRVDDAQENKQEKKEN